MLKKNHKVVVIDNLSTGRIQNISKFLPRINFIKADLAKKGKWMSKLKNVHTVFHLAALADIVPSITIPEKYFNANVIGTLNLLQSCLKNRVKKVIYTASSSCYGIPKKYPTNEESEIDPKYPYALTKRLGEELILHWSKLHKFDAISFRLFNVYGTRSRTSGTYGAMFGVFLSQKLAKIPFTIVGTGKQSRDFTYVTDVINGLVLGFRAKIKNEIFNLGTGKAISVNKIVRLLKGKKTFIPNRPGEPEKTLACIKKIKKQLKWKPRVNIETGIKLLLKDIDYWKKAPIWTPSKIKEATRVWFKLLG